MCIFLGIHCSVPLDFCNVIYAGSFLVQVFLVLMVPSCLIGRSAWCILGNNPDWSLPLAASGLKARSNQIGQMARLGHFVSEKWHGDKSIGLLKERDITVVHKSLTVNKWLEQSVANWFRSNSTPDFLSLSQINSAINVLLESYFK